MSTLPPRTRFGKLATPFTVVAVAPETMVPSLPEIEIEIVALAWGPETIVFPPTSLSVAVGARPVLPAGAEVAVNESAIDAGSPAWML